MFPNNIIYKKSNYVGSYKYLTLKLNGLNSLVVLVLKRNQETGDSMHQFQCT